MTVSRPMRRTLLAIVVVLAVIGMTRVRLVEPRFPVGPPPPVPAVEKRAELNYRICPTAEDTIGIGIVIVPL